MHKQTIPLGRIGDISIGLDYSWFLIFGLLTWLLAVRYYPGELKDWSTTLYWLMGAITTIMLFVSVLLHELGHSVIALRYKIPVRRITLMVFGGVAEIGDEPPALPPNSGLRWPALWSASLWPPCLSCCYFPGRGGAPPGFGQVSGFHQWLTCPL